MTMTTIHFRRMKAEPWGRGASACAPWTGDGANLAPGGNGPAGLRPKSSRPAFLFLLLLLLLPRPAAFSQAGLQDLFYTAATTRRDASGRPWAYLVWDATTPAILEGSHYAIYRKDGDAGSTALYQRVALVQRQTDPRIIQALVNRAVHLGGNPTELDDGMTKLFRTMTNAMSLPLPEKISAVIRGSAGQAAFESHLRLLGRSHPALAMALGLGHAELIPAGVKSTFEVRQFDPAKGRDLGVVGRVSVDPDAPVILPAPGAPVAVPENNPKGHLNAKLRWATPDDLRRFSLLNHGYNVWRIDAALALANQFHLTPPATSNLLALSATHSHQVRRVNHAPIVPATLLDAVSATNLAADASTVFLTDDNDRFRGGTAFQNGDRFYYFVTARDLLGRDGLVSAGLPVTLCNRLPPSPPKELRVENDYTYTNSAGRQVFKLSWKPNVNTPEDTATAYLVYRWIAQTQMLAFDAAGDYLAHRIAGPIPHLAGVTQMCVFDDSPDAPSMPADADATYWYTVRAIETNACGTNFSPNSPVVFGVLRDRVGPPAPTGWVELDCPSPTINPLDSFGSPEPGQDPYRVYYRAQATRLGDFLHWAEFTARVRKRGLVQQNPPVVGEVEEILPLGRVEFNETGLAEIDFDLARTNLLSVTFEARAVLANGMVSPTATFQNVVPLPSGLRQVAWFRADTVRTPTLLSSPREVRITSVQFSTNNGVVLHFTPALFASSRILVSSDLPGGWSEISGPVYATPGSVAFQDAGRASQPRRYYRLIADDYAVPPPCAHISTYQNGISQGIKQVVQLTPGSKEFKIYRRVDDGPLNLIAQGRGDYDQTGSVTNLDQALPAGAVTMCYYVQLSDRHGNPGPMTQLGACFVANQSPPPCPVVSAVERTGTTANRSALVRWFSPTSGVDYFEIRLAPKATAATPATPGGNPGTTAGSSRYRTTMQRAGETLTVVFGAAAVTDRIGSPALGNGPQFSWTITNLDEQEYTVHVVAVNKAGDRSGPKTGCNRGRRFQWTGPPLGTVPPQVPWPARPNLPVSTMPSVTARLLYQRTDSGLVLDQEHPAGIAIGSLTTASLTTNYLNCTTPPRILGFQPADSPADAGPTTILSVVANPLQHVYNAGPAGTDKLLPAVLYRTQVTNAAFPKVSGDVMQVSPLLEDIAHRLEPAAAPTYTWLLDPFIRATDHSEFPRSEFIGRGPNPAVPGCVTCGCDYYRVTTPVDYRLFLVDTQPALAGATYRYFLMRFDARTKEPIEVIDAGTLEIPAN